MSGRGVFSNVPSGPSSPGQTSGPTKAYKVRDKEWWVYYRTKKSLSSGGVKRSFYVNFPRQDNLQEFGELDTNVVCRDFATTWSPPLFSPRLRVEGSGIDSWSPSSVDGRQFYETVDYDVIKRFSALLKSRDTILSGSVRDPVSGNVERFLHRPFGSVPGVLFSHDHGCTHKSLSGITSRVPRTRGTKSRPLSDESRPQGSRSYIVFCSVDFYTRSGSTIHTGTV